MCVWSGDSSVHVESLRSKQWNSVFLGGQSSGGQIGY